MNFGELLQQINPNSVPISHFNSLPNSQPKLNSPTKFTIQFPHSTQLSLRKYTRIAAT